MCVGTQLRQLRILFRQGTRSPFCLLKCTALSPCVIVTHLRCVFRARLSLYAFRIG